MRCAHSEWLWPLRLLVTGILLTVCVPALAQNVTYRTDNYYDYLPGALPKHQTAITATPASTELGLFGRYDDPDYRDEDLNGIDDQRQERLSEIAEMFAPILRRTNYSVPRDVREVLQLQFDPDSGHLEFGKHELLHVDTWDLTKPRSLNRHLATIDFDCIRARASGDDDPVCLDTCDECLLQRVLSDLNPAGWVRRYVRPDSATDTILYFDFPGSGERSWKRIYSRLAEMEQVRGGFDTRIYAHFFVHEAPDAVGERRYRLVIQYWFFYPFNDGGNNHEGDWEHLNVHITTDSLRDQRMTANEIEAILSGSEPAAQLITKEIDYYFHHYVMTLDFIDDVFDFYRMSISEIRSLLDDMPQRENIRRWKIYRLMHDRVRMFEGCGIRWNRHPIGLIGANSRGPELLLKLPEGSNRDSHGTYPFGGIWKQIGPLAATEELGDDQAAPFRKRTAFRFQLPEPEQSMHNEVPGCQTAPDALLESEYQNTDNDQFLTYDRSRITLLPDWERVWKLMTDHEPARTKWYWLVLPIRWGFPASDSPGGGLFTDVDLGNVAPVGPAYNTAWNRVGEERGYEEYDAHHIPAIWQIDLTDNFANKLGFLNAGGLILELPGLNSLRFLWRAYRPRRKFTRSRPPSSFIDFQTGFGVHGLDKDYATFLSEAVGQGSKGSITDDGERYWIRASTRLNRFESAIGFEWLTGGRILTSNDVDPAQLGMHELFGDLTLRLTGSKLAPFLLGGYGYRRVRYTGNFGEKGFGWTCSVDSGVKNWVPDIASCFKPNVWHVGGGIDWMFFKNDDTAFLWNGQVPDLGLRVGYKANFERLPNADWGTRHDVNVALILGF
ncbi:MAG: hypothetical protein WBW88_05675 [Rhodothermales bacterium]